MSAVVVVVMIGDAFVLSVVVVDEDEIAWPFDSCVVEDKEEFVREEKDDDDDDDGDDDVCLFSRSSGQA